MQNLQLTAKRNGYSLAEAQIRINNAASIKLHEKLGYIQIKKSQTETGMKFTYI